MEKKTTAFKHWINSQVVEKYARGLDSRSRNKFRALAKQLSQLELRARVQLLARGLREALAPQFPQALQELLQITRDQNLRSFELWPATEFIQIFGLEHIDESLEAMAELTQKFTAEFSIRPFLNTHGPLVFEKLKKWQNHPNEHIRRWLSEGTRPRLPWGEKLRDSIQNPRPGLEILEQLKFDPSLYVRKSVANHLNDIAKDHPALVVKTLKAWSKKVPEGYEKNFDFLRHRALRTLVKDGDLRALRLLGIESRKSFVKIKDFKILKNRVTLNSSLEFFVVLKNLSSKPEKYILDFVVYFQKSNQTLNPKVFKLKTGSLNGKAEIKIQKKFSFRPVSTRKYYPGRHQLTLKLNGVETNSQDFILAKF